MTIQEIDGHIIELRETLSGFSLEVNGYQITWFSLDHESIAYESYRRLIHAISLKRD